MKKIIVASFQRSGTHFLINSLATNFLNIEDGWVDIVHSKDNRWVQDVNRRNLRDKIREQLLDVYSSHPMRRCLKTHFQVYFFERIMELLTERYDVLYIVRDPRDTMVACFNYYNNTHFEAFIKEPVFSKFLRTELWDVRSEVQPFSYSYVKPRNIADKWSKHVLSWMHYKDRGVTFVKYGDLKRNPEATLKYIESRTQQRLKGNVVPVSLADARYRPDFQLPGLKRGEIGAWKSYFSREDLHFLDQTVAEQTKQFYDE